MTIDQFLELLTNTVKTWTLRDGPKSKRILIRDTLAACPICSLARMEGWEGYGTDNLSAGRFLKLSTLDCTQIAKAADGEDLELRQKLLKACNLL